MKPGGLYGQEHLLSRQKFNQVLNLPRSVSNASSHCRSSLDGRMDTAEIVVHEVERHRVRVHLDFLAEGVGQSRESPHRHPHREILALDVARGDVFFVGVA